MSKKKSKKPRPAPRAAAGPPAPAPAARPTARAMGWTAALVANVLVLGTLAYVAILNASSSELYYTSLQEDEYLEWATFWAFMIGAGVFVAGAVWQRRATGKLPWFLLGVGLFCFVVAMEEISWGQRVLGYRPPAYFLEHNFQQELNVHNVIETGLRKLALKGVILGYGIVLPLVALAAPVRRWLARIAVVAPPAALVPSFAAAYWLYEAYPWKFSGEVVELLLGGGFLFAALAAVQAYRDAPPPAWRRLAPYAVAWVAVFALGLANAAVSRSQRSANPDAVTAAQTEAEALARDFIAMAEERGGRWSTKCGLHKRVYSFFEKYDTEYLLEGDYAALTAQGLPEERAAYFIDPWSSPYWIRHRCSKGRVRIFVYSFGPNRSRDSSQWEVLGDDVGAMIHSRD